MKWLRSYSQHSRYMESLSFDLSVSALDLMESIGIWHDALLSSISAKEEDIFDAFSLPKDEFSGKIDLDFLEDSVEFVNSLSSIGLKKSAAQNSEDYQTFLNKPCRFMFIYKADRNELEEPEYVIFQSWSDSADEWEQASLYRVNDRVSKFYDKLTSKTVEISDGDENYIYQTSNGSDWVLQNSEKENDIYKKSFRKEEIQKLISERGVRLSII